MACSTSETKTFSSAIFPVFTAVRIASTAHRTIVRHRDLEFHFRQKINSVLAAAINLAMTFLPPGNLLGRSVSSLPCHFPARVFDRFGLERLGGGFVFLSRPD